jgi:hypothetical protein
LKYLFTTSPCAIADIGASTITKLVISFFIFLLIRC